MSADRDHEAKVRAIEAAMAGELVRIKRIGPPLPTLTNVVPVQYERCFVCGGDGWIETRLNGDGIGEGRTCAYCNGHGQIAVEVTP